MKKVLIKDLIVPAGTVFDNAPLRTERPGDGCVQAIIGLSKNTAGSVEYWLDGDEEEMQEWFRDLR